MSDVTNIIASLFIMVAPQNQPQKLADFYEHVNDCKTALNNFPIGFTWSAKREEKMPSSLVFCVPGPAWNRARVKALLDDFQRGALEGARKFVNTQGNKKCDPYTVLMSEAYDDESKCAGAKEFIVQFKKNNSWCNGLEEDERSYWYCYGVGGYVPTEMLQVLR